MKKNRKKNRIKTLNQTIPEDKFYKYLSFILMGVILVFVGWLIYNQFNPAVQPELVKEVDRKFDDKLSCLNNCQDAFKENPLNLTIEDIEGGLKVTNADKYYYFSIPKGTEIIENSELEGISISYPGTSCKIPLKILHADSTGLSIEDWLKVNYPDQEMEAKLQNYEGFNIYRTEWPTTDVEDMSYFFRLGENVIEARYFMGYLTASSCDKGSYIQQVEETISTFRSLSESREYFELLGD